MNQKNKNIKKVRFDTSQQWRMNHRQIRVNNAGSGKNIHNNLSSLKNGTTPLKRAQAAYYGNRKATTNRSPLLINNSKRNDNVSKLPVHARLGARPGNSNRNVPAKNINTGQVSQVQKLLAQKRALRMKTIEQNRKLRQLEELAKKRKNIRMKAGGGGGGTLKSDKMFNNFQVNSRRGGGAGGSSGSGQQRTRQKMKSQNDAADLSVSVANDFAIQRQILNNKNNGYQIKGGGHAINRPQQLLHSNELNPHIQREISLIQERNRRMNLDTTSIAAATMLPLSITSAAAAAVPLPSFHAFNRSIDTPFNSLGGITTSIITETRPKLSLHERFSLL